MHDVQEADIIWVTIQLQFSAVMTRSKNCGWRMRRECRDRFPHHRLQRKLLVSDPSMHHGPCITHVPWCMLGSLTRGGGGKHFWYSLRMHNPQFYVSGKRPMAQLTYGAEVLYGLLCRPVVHTVTLRQQHELVELTEDGVTRLMDGEHDGTAVTG